MLRPGGPDAVRLVRGVMKSPRTTRKALCRGKADYLCCACRGSLCVGPAIPKGAPCTKQKGAKRQGNGRSILRHSREFDREGVCR